MTYLVYIAGWHLSQSEKRQLFNTVHETIEWRRKSHYLQNHPELNAETRTAIKNGKARISSMSKENIKASLGNPEAVKPVMGTFMNTERWSYYSKRIEL